MNLSETSPIPLKRRGEGGEEGGVVLFGRNMVVTAEGYFVGSVVVWGWGTTRFGTGILAIWMGLVCGELPVWGKVGLRGNDCGGDVKGGAERTRLRRQRMIWCVQSNCKTTSQSTGEIRSK